MEILENIRDYKIRINNKKVIEWDYLFQIKKI